MNSGTPPSPYDSGDLDQNGNEVCRFTVNYSNTAPNPLASIVAWNSSGSPYTAIQVTNASTSAVRTLPLPTNGAKETTGTRAGWFKATVTQAQINAAGFTNFYDIGSYTVI